MSSMGGGIGERKREEELETREVAREEREDFWSDGSDQTDLEKDPRTSVS